MGQIKENDLYISVTLFPLPPKGHMVGENLPSILLLNFGGVSLDESRWLSGTEEFATFLVA